MRKQEKAAQSQDATFAQKSNKKDVALFRGDDGKEFITDKKEWINKANLLFILTAARNTALGTQHHDPKEVCEIFDAIIDLIDSLDAEAEQQEIKSGKARKCICCQERITTETYGFCTHDVSVAIPLCEECRNIEDIQSSLLCMPFIIAAKEVKKDVEQVYLKHLIKKMEENETHDE